ncbi:MAG TPA: hypothetical protein DEO86_11800, partial [Colwellia sp.]|nr:hypothetical protein [Colwellia sp.]
MVENNIDQKIQAVVGETIEEAIENEEPIEIEIVTEETLIEDSPIEKDFFDNLAEEMEENELGRISSNLMGDYENDRASREEWASTYTQGL